MLVRLVLCFFVFAKFSAHAQEVDSRPVYGDHFGYLFNVADEKNRRDVEMVMLEPPKEQKKPFNQVIFNEKLSKEFHQQYQYRFGQTQAQQIMNSPGRFDGYSYYTDYNNQQNVSAQEYQKYQRTFAEYMGRRLFEYHFDNWAKNNSVVRPVYQLKDRVSKLNVEVKKNYKMKIKYSFSGNYLDLSMENPQKIENKFTLQMRQSGFGPSTPEEYIYTLGLPVTKKIRVTGLVRQMDGIYQLVGTQQITPHLSTSITGSLDTLPAGPTTKQNLLLVGLSWNE